MNVYNIEVPLIYNSGNVYETFRKETSHFWELGSPIEKIVDGMDFVIENFEQGSILKIFSVSAKGEDDAFAIISPYLDKVCKALSMLIVEQNIDNRKLFHCRVSPLYASLKIYEIVYSDEDEEILHGAFQLDELEFDTHNLRDFVQIELSSNINTLCFDNYFDNQDKVFRFIMDELYLALGTEHIESKFFHLFSIIERIEKDDKYAKFRGAKMLLDDEEISNIKDLLQKGLELEKDKKERVINAVSDKLNKTTDLGRNAKLANILHAMDIYRYNDAFVQFEVNSQKIQEWTTLRNKCFHGEGVCDSTVSKAVTELLYICYDVVAYERTHPSTNDEDMRT